MPIVVPVRFRYAAIDLWFDPDGNPVHRGDHLVVETERGLEIGLAVDEAFNVNEETLRAPLKPVIRIADEADLARADELGALSDKAFGSFKEIVERSGLDMKPVACEYLFDGDKIVCYFAADDRIDFRDLVRELAAVFKLRVDMRQIGVRDEARLVGGFGHCGQELCCKRFGREFEPVSIRMAKEQDLPLNPAKISGACGRLMCCLRYEYYAYKDFKSRAPKQGALIDTPLGTAKVVSFNTPRELVSLRLENGKQFEIPLKDMTCNLTSSCCASSHKPQSGVSVSEQEEHAAACCCTQQQRRPNCVSRAVLEKLENQMVSLLLNQLDTQELLSEEEAEASPVVPVVSERKSRKKRLEKEQDAGHESLRDSSVPRRVQPSETTAKAKRRPGDGGAYLEREGKKGGAIGENSRATRRRRAARTPEAAGETQPVQRQAKTRRVHQQSSETSKQHAAVAQQKEMGQDRVLRRHKKAPSREQSSPTSAARQRRRRQTSSE